MASKRRPLHPGNSSPKFNFRPNNVEPPSWEPKGRKPIPEPTSVHQVLLMMVLHVCRKIIFVDTSIKVGVYGGCLFLVSLIADVLPIPKTYFSRSDNIFNQYFVKLGWGWTMMLVLPFIVLSSYTYCCGKRDRVLKHLARLGIATANWYIWTSLFSYVETNYGRCNAVGKSFQNKRSCLASGNFWHGFDMSGHAFILIYSSLVLIEEARAIIGWEGIKELIMNEDHARTTTVATDISTNPLRLLSKKELSSLKQSYTKFTPYIRALFIGMTCLTVLWDVMLISTVLYYHIMIEKFVSGAIAILLWFFTYRYWYTLPNVPPNLPGEGLFKYNVPARQLKELPLKRKVSSPTKSNPGSKDQRKDQLPKFMGMPLYGLRNKVDGNSTKDETEESTNMTFDNSTLPTSRV